MQATGFKTMEVPFQNSLEMNGASDLSYLSSSPVCSNSFPAVEIDESNVSGRIAAIRDICLFIKEYANEDVQENQRAIKVAKEIYSKLNPEVNLSNEDLINAIQKINTIKWLHISTRGIRKLLTVLPDTIGELENLMYLELPSNDLKILPNSLERAKNMISIDLSGNENVKTLPDFLLKFDNLRRVQITRTGIETLSESFSKIIHPADKVARWTEKLHNTSSQNESVVVNSNS